MKILGSILALLLVTSVAGAAPSTACEDVFESILETGPAEIGFRPRLYSHHVLLTPARQISLAPQPPPPTLAPEQIEKELTSLQRIFKMPTRSLKYETARALFEHRFINQADDGLRARGLLIEGYGVCGSACLAYAMTSALANHREQMSAGDLALIDDPAALVHEIIRTIERRSPHQGDPRRGTKPGTTEKAARDLASRFKLGDGFHIERSFYTTSLFEHLRKSPDQIGIATLQIQGGGHAVLLLHGDLKKGFAWIIDPNFNFEIQKIRIQKVGSDILFWDPHYALGPDENNPAHWLNLYSILLFTQDRPKETRRWFPRWLTSDPK